MRLRGRRDTPRRLREETVQEGSCVGAVDQSFTQAALTAELPLDALHPPVIALVIVPQEVKQAVQSEDAPFEMLGMAGVARLALRHPAGDGDIAVERAFQARGKV